jgi:predicted metal-dependent enzyme (double-stranded beta helix superfamily)
MKVHELVATLAKAGASSNPMHAAREVMEGLRNDIDALAEALRFVSGVGGNPQQVFYRSPELTLLKVSFPNGRRTPPHDHATWATILLMSGMEKNTLYRSEQGGLRKAGEATLERGSILPMMADTVHVAECLGDEPAVGLHVYGGDILALPRRMWNPETLEQHPLEWKMYESFARIASSAGGAPLA